MCEVEVALGHARPALLHELDLDAADVQQPTPQALAGFDRAHGFVAHRRLLARFAERKRAIARIGRDRADGARAQWLRLRYRLRYGRE